MIGTDTISIEFTRQELVDRLRGFFGPFDSAESGEVPLGLDKKGNVRNCTPSASEQIKAYMLDTHGSLRVNFGDMDALIMLLLRQATIHYDHLSHRFAIKVSPGEFVAQLTEIAQDVAEESRRRRKVELAAMAKEFTRKELINELEKILGPSSIDSEVEHGIGILGLDKNGNVRSCSPAVSEQIKAYVLDTYGSLDAHLIDRDTAIMFLLTKGAIRYDSKSHYFVIKRSLREALLTKNASDDSAKGEISE